MVQDLNGRFLEWGSERMYGSRSVRSCVARDITERQRAESALRESEERLRLFVEYAPAAIAMFDREMRYLAVSRRFVSDYRLSPDDVIGRSHYEVFPEIPERWKEIHRRCLAGAVESCDEDPFPRADSTLDWVRWEIRPWNTAAGQIGGIILFSEVITARKQVEEALRESEERFRLLVQGIEDCAIYMLAPDGTVKSWSGAAEQIFGYREEEIIGQHRAVFFTEEDRRAGQPQKDLEEAAAHGRCEHEAWRVRKDGSLLWANVLITALRDDAGGLRGFASVHRDFTERRRAEAALRETEEKYVAIHDKAPFGIALTKLPEATFVTANDAFLRLFGFSRGEVIGKTSVELGIADPDTQAVVRRELERSGSLRDLELTRRTRSGARIDLSLSVERVTIAGSEYVLTTLQDITARKVAEERLAYVASFPEKNPNPVVEVEVDDRVTYANPAALRLFPDLLEKGVAHPWVAGAGSTAPSSSPGGSAVAERVLTIGDRTFLQTLARLPRQEVRIYAAEITARERAERALRAREAELELILDRTPFMLTRCSRDLRYRYVSGAYAKMIGRTPNQIAGRPIVEIMGEQGLETIRPHVEAVLRGEPVEYEDEVHFAGVGSRWLQVIYVPDRDERDQVVGWIANIVDVTERRQAEALRTANMQLLEADRNRTEFLAVLSHELRNPLAPIRNSLYILGRVAPGGEQARHAQAVIERQIWQMTRLIDDLLDVTRVTRGKIRLQREALDLNDLVQRTVDDHRTLFSKNEIRLEMLPAPLEVPVNGDRVRLAQAIGNLLQNAAKFTPGGGTTTVSVEADSARGEAVLTVRDSGSGIQPDMLARLFHPFTQADATLDRSKGGLGLGLALVKGLAELHGGSVSAASAGRGQGAAFTIRLPLDTSVARAIPLQRAEAGARGAPRRILVIEDNEDAAQSLRDVLELDEHLVEVAYSGRGGIEKARSFHPDVVLCDIGLPEMDGYEAARKMRADPDLCHVALVAVSGYAQPEDVAMAREAGFDAHLAKPPSIDNLERVLEEVRNAHQDPHLN
jgi:PAS domain S-box-containing protein